LDEFTGIFNKGKEAMLMDIETRVATSLAVNRYLRAAERFEAASLEFNEACQSLRSVLPKPCEFVVNVNHSHHVVTSDDQGNFEIKAIDVL
jgi:hypothetical protein